MSAFTKSCQSVSPEEVARRIGEYCRIGFERGLPAQVVYQDPHVVCPWPGCGYRINAIQFHLEKWPQLENRLLKAWWQGPGLAGRCPKCNLYVLFSVTAKSVIDDLTDFSSANLPDDWHKNAHVVTKPEQLSQN